MTSRPRRAIWARAEASWIDVNAPICNRRYTMIVARIATNAMIGTTAEVFSSRPITSAAVSE